MQRHNHNLTCHKFSAVWQKTATLCRPLLPFTHNAADSWVSHHTIITFSGFIRGKAMVISPLPKKSCLSEYCQKNPLVRKLSSKNDKFGAKDISNTFKESGCQKLHLPTWHTVRSTVQSSKHCAAIPRLHDQANIEQSSSKHPVNAFKIHVHDACSNCSMFAWWLLCVGYTLCILHFSRCLLDACLMFASSCKRGITTATVTRYWYLSSSFVWRQLLSPVNSAQ